GEAPNRVRPPTPDEPQIFGARPTGPRRASSAEASDASAAPYIGEVSTTRQPPATAASTIRPASSASPSNVLQVPSPTTGPRRRSSINLPSRAPPRRAPA